MKRILVVLTLVLMLAGCAGTKTESAKVLTNDEWNTVAEGIFNEMELPAMMPLSDVELTDYLGINAENLESFLVMLPMMNVHATEIMVYQAKEGMLETVTEEVNVYLENYEQMWSTYLPDQYELVQNRVQKTVGNTLIVIIAEDTAAIEAKIDAALAE
jgi:hypothetical protein